MVRLEQGLGRLALDNVALLVDDEAGNVAEPLGYAQLALHVLLRVRFLVDQTRAFLGLGLGLDGRLEADDLDDGRAVRVGDAVDFCVGSLGDLCYPVAGGADIGPGEKAQVVVAGCILGFFFLFVMLIPLVGLLQCLCSSGFTPHMCWCLRG